MKVLSDTNVWYVTRGESGSFVVEELEDGTQRVTCRLTGRASTWDGQGWSGPRTAGHEHALALYLERRDVGRRLAAAAEPGS